MLSHCKNIPAPKSMLPSIDLRPADYCTIGFNYCLGLSLPIGHTLWFDREAVRQAGKAAGLNLDEYLTGLLASWFMKEKAASSILTFFAGIPARLALSLCSPGPMPFLHGAHPGAALPGCLDLRHDFIPQTAAPFLLYDGRSIFRLHPLTQPERTAFYIWDFGDCLGNFLKQVDKAFYFRVLNDKTTYIDYGVVPKNPLTTIHYPDRAIPVHHAVCRQI
jgi:hypothetical protein